ncbi:hypothetical protein BZA70DRAFT_292449 [Myxozyma melibiosi]|uniref:BZIP domain-containing protein n=1 Tax=Myxozyma melibiosi TaxID=54550 RepID=A0ABR1FB20_9ASCO
MPSTPIAIQPAANIAPQPYIAPAPAPAIAPRIKPESPEDSAGVSCIRPSKEWVLPPRPKPGRKPSTETPPTKRKAQNRAAQRAFRERRAARVVELEERLHDLEQEKEDKEQNLTNTLLRIAAENQQLKSVTDELKQQVELFKQFQAQQAAAAAAGMQGAPMAMAQQPAHNLVSPAPSPGNEQNYSQDMLDRALEERLPVDPAATASPASTTGTTISSPSSQQYQYTSPSATQGLYGQSVPLRRASKQKYSSPKGSSPPAYANHRSSISIAHGSNHPSPLHTSEESPKSDSCGLCQSDGNCMCSDIGIKPATDIFPKRAHTSAAPSPAAPAPAPEHPNKRIRRDDEDDTEMDFTHAFTTAKINRRPQQAQNVYNQPPEQHQHRHNSDYSVSDNYFSSSDRSSKSGPRKIDPCGFCSSGTPCLCAEAADAEAREMEDRNQSQNQGQMMNGMTDDDMNTTLPPLRNDPHSELIRQTSKHKLVTLHPEPISDMTGTNGAVAQQFAPGTCESCQRDPMQTLFCTSLASKSGSEGGGCGNCNQPGGCCGGKKASVQDSAFIPCSAAYQTLSRHKGFKAVELPSLVGKLSTKGGQVEVASVASVLRELDRRLYN